MQRTAYILLMLILSISCKKEVAAPVLDNKYDEASSAYVPTPNLNTAPISDILALSAKSGGTFENDYGKPVTAKGVCWGLAQNPTVGGSCTSEGPNTTSYSSNLTGLVADTLYYVRAYATNEAGTIYGGQRSFRTKDGIATFGEVKTMSVLAKSATLWMVVTGDGTAPISRKGFVWAEGVTPTMADSVASFGAGLGSATRPLANLKPGTEYLMRAFAESAARVTYSAPIVFTTQSGQPQFSGLGVSAVTSSGSTISVTIDSDGGDAITARGVCYSTQPDPTTAGTCVASGNGTVSYSVTVTGLEKATVYFIRPYATNSVMTGYGAQASFVTAAVLPSVETGIASLIGATSTTVSGNVTSDGGSNQTSRGICYANTQNPTTANTCVASGTGAGAFEAVLTGLSMGTTYYARAYATNPIGTTYGSQISFTTLTGPSVTTGVISDITSTGASVAGKVSVDGGSTVTTRGICYSTSQNPSTSGTCVASESGTGAFSANLTGLALGTTYYVRAYATNSVATSYGTQSSFTTLALPTVTTGIVSAITSSGASVAGNVTASGGATVTSRGICFASTENPTTTGTCVASGSGTGSFTAALTGLAFATTYFVRAYSTNSAGTSYGSQTSFSTLPVVPTVTTGLVSSITSTAASVAGDVIASGGATVTARGICYSTSQNPTTSGTCVVSGSGTGVFSVTIAGLSPGMTYYVWAYSTNSVGTGYGAEVSFTTLTTPPSVTTESVSSITSNSAVVAGKATADGGTLITTRGICYSTAENPTTAGTCVASGTGTGSYSASLTELSLETTYYARAYATNNAGTAYGIQIIFTTGGHVTDIDGNLYLTVQIGTQVWMAENLRTTRYRSGATIANVTNATTWAELSSGAWAHFDNNAANETVYGKMYNWYAAIDSRNICPTGWHVPSDAEWTVLSNFLGSDVGFKMKSTSGWIIDGNGSNASGFNGLPGGIRSSSGIFVSGGTSRQGTGYFWSSSQSSSVVNNSGTAWVRFLSNSSRGLFRNYRERREGFSVRCLRD